MKVVCSCLSSFDNSISLDKPHLVFYNRRRDNKRCTNSKDTHLLRDFLLGWIEVPPWAVAWVGAEDTTPCPYVCPGYVLQNLAWTIILPYILYQRRDLYIRPITRKQKLCVIHSFVHSFVHSNNHHLVSKHARLFVRGLHQLEKRTVVSWGIFEEQAMKPKYKSHSAVWKPNGSYCVSCPWNILVPSLQIYAQAIKRRVVSSFEVQISCYSFEI